MSEPKPTVRLSPWLGGSIGTLLVLQLGLLWTQGSMLQRQHEDIQGLREDVQALAESLDQNQEGWDSSGSDGNPSPVRLRLRRGRSRLVRARYLQAEPEDDHRAKKELEDSRASARDAVAKGRDVQQKLSIEENIRKADEKAKVEAEGRKWRPWLWAASGLALLAMVTRSWIRRRG